MKTVTSYVKSILFISIAPLVIGTCFFSKQIEVKDYGRTPSVEVAYTKSYDFSGTKKAFPIK